MHEDGHFARRLAGPLLAEIDGLRFDATCEPACEGAANGAYFGSNRLLAVGEFPNEDLFLQQRLVLRRIRRRRPPCQTRVIIFSPFRLYLLPFRIGSSISQWLQAGAQGPNRCPLSARPPAPSAPGLRVL